jgi:GntR family transcriptional regulator
MQFKLETNAHVPIFQQLVNQIRHRIAANLLKPGDKLPTVRDLAVQLVINPNTVQKAYTDLSNLGLIHSRKGQGIFVSEFRPTLAPDEIRRRVTVAADHYITEALLLGYTRYQISELTQQQLEVFVREEPNGQ